MALFKEEVEKYGYTREGPVDSEWETDYKKDNLILRITKNTTGISAGV